METLGLIAAAGVGYLIGAVPAGYLVARVVRGVDIRQVGSGRTGTTNALRTLGPVGAALVLLLDLGKGLAASILCAAIASVPGAGFAAWGAALGGLAAVMGHIWPAFLGFRGGRGVATGAGALLVQAPLPLLAAAPVMIAVVWATRYVSLGSLLAVAVASLVASVLVVLRLAHPAVLLFMAGVAVAIVLAHADNIERLRTGTERRIGDRAPGPEEAGRA